MKTVIKADVAWMSCVGVPGVFPYARGNYFTNSEGFYFTNLWAENLKHAINSGMINDGLIEVELFKDSSNYGYAYVTDPRVPSEALHAPYFCGIAHSVEIVRMHHKIEPGTCLCEVDNYKLTGFRSGDMHGLHSRFCHECGAEFVIQQPRRDGVYRVQLLNTSGFPKWVPAWYSNGKFSNLQCMSAIDDEVILKVGINRISEFGSVDDQTNSIPLADFNYSGLISKDTQC